MGRCRYENLKSLEPAFDQIRKLKDLQEPKPGIFYLKSQGFLHFHEKDGNIWADVRDDNAWGDPLPIPAKVTKTFLNSFVKEVYNRYERSGGKV